MAVRKTRSPLRNSPDHKLQLTIVCNGKLDVELVSRTLPTVEQ
jgi:hypothetical protein